MEWGEIYFFWHFFYSGKEITLENMIFHSPHWKKIKELSQKKTNTLIPIVFVRCFYFFYIWINEVKYMSHPKPLACPYPVVLTVHF